MIRLPFFVSSVLVLVGCAVPSGDCTSSSGGFFGSSSIALNCGKGDTGDSDTGSGIGTGDSDTGGSDSDSTDTADSDTGVIDTSDTADTVDTVDSDSDSADTGIDTADSDSDSADTDTADTSIETADSDSDSADTGVIDTSPIDTSDTGVVDSGVGDSDSGVASVDVDGDGFTADDDCNDKDATINPDATELCDSVDNNCDGVVDAGAADQTTFFADADGDGYGDATLTETACSASVGFVADATDCDDADATIHPYAKESCTDTVDLNCDGSAGAADADGDGTVACEDCDDANASAFPGNTETCDGVDNDCEGTVDEDATDELSWFQDGDADGFGNSAIPTAACEQPLGFVFDATDCDDADAGINPGVVEVCNGVDDDCDGDTDEDLSRTTYYLDTDGDGYGTGEGISECADPGVGYSAIGADCDDTVASVNPGAMEVCNGVDDDCTGTADDGAVDASAWYRDADRDGRGDSAIFTFACSEPSGYTADDTDCDDTNNDSYPGNIEHCDGVDNDCSGSADDGDYDGDDYDVCSDCDDGDASLNPGQPEVCNGADDDCNGVVDDGISSTYYRDADGDAFGGSESATSSCSGAPAGYVADATDCDDGDAGVNPGETEIVGNGVDDDCSGTELVFTTDFGISTGVCILDGAYTSTGAAVRQAGGCYIWIEGYGSLTAPVVSIDIDVAGLTVGDDYIFSWDVGNASASTTTFVGAIDGSSIESLSLGTGTSGTLEDIVTVGSSTVTASVWHTGENSYDGYLTGFTVER